MNSDVIEFICQNIDILCCPRCKEEVRLSNGRLSCTSCDRIFTINDGILDLFCPNDWEPQKEDITEKMKAFYEETPFPNYDELDDVSSLMEKAKNSLFGELLNEQIPFNARVIECGCGTGQLSNYLSVANRKVIGADLCLNSLKLANNFKRANNLKRVSFVQMNLFQPAFKPNSFDLVISNGVLQVTSDPLLGFKEIAKLVKPKGYLIIGLYHRYGRLFTDMRRKLFYLTNNRFQWMDKRLVDENISPDKRKAWFMDQYKIPYESKHTVGDVLKWLEGVNLSFVSSIPKTKPFQGRSDLKRLFQPDELGSRLERFISDIGCMADGHREGGFFTVIARKD